MMRCWHFLIFFAVVLDTTVGAAPFSFTNFNEVIKCTASGGLIVPNSTSDAAAAVRAASTTGQNVRVITQKRWSITDVICPGSGTGVVISMQNFKHLSYDSDAQSVTVGTGWRVADLTSQMAALYNVSFIHLPSFGSITVGGAISTGAHGSSLRHVSSLSDQVVGLEVIHPDGSVHNVTDPALLNHYRVAVGSLGVITSVTFSVVPMFKVHWSTSSHSESVLTDGTLLSIAQMVDGIYVYWNPYQKSVVIATMEYVDVSTPGNDYWNYIPEINQAIRLVQKATLEGLQAGGLETLFCENENAVHQRLTTNTALFGFVAPYFNDASTHQISGMRTAVGLNSTGFANNMLASGCVDCPFSQPHGIFYNDFGIDVPIEQFIPAINFSLSVMAKAPACFPLSDILIRFRKPSNNDLSGSFGGVYASIEWDTTHRDNPLRDPELDLLAVQWMSQGYLLNYQGRSHWGKTGNFPFYASPNNLPNSTALYPQLQAFLDFQRSIDPAGIFRNDFYKSALLGDPSVIHNKTYDRCALVYDCVCSNDSHCAAHQTCISQPLANGNVAKLCVAENSEFASSVVRRQL